MMEYCLAIKKASNYYESVKDPTQFIGTNMDKIKSELAKLKDYPMN